LRKKNKNNIIIKKIIKFLTNIQKQNKNNFEIIINSLVLVDVRLINPYAMAFSLAQFYVLLYTE